MNKKQHFFREAPQFYRIESWFELGTEAWGRCSLVVTEWRSRAGLIFLTDELIEY